jgi:hypothetical protein
METIAGGEGMQAYHCATALDPQAILGEESCRKTQKKSELPVLMFTIRLQG